MQKETLKLDDLVTPCCLIEKSIMQRNIKNLSDRIGTLGCKLRPHVKTHKSLDVTREIMSAGNAQGITVSTLKEAEHFFENGYSDILYAVGVTPNKFQRVVSLIQAGCDLKVIIDNYEMALNIIELAAKIDCMIKVMIEIDTDGHRAGIDPCGAELIGLAKALDNAVNIELIGIMTHAGGSYSCFTEESKLKIAKQERDLSLHAAKVLRDNGIKCPVVSIGSTPTAFAIDNLDGITEVRAGVYVFFDMVMAGLNVCSKEDIAISVLSSVIGHQLNKNQVITDSGWMALSRDLGTTKHPIDYAYGLIKTSQDSPVDDYVVSATNQEHGVITHREQKQAMQFETFPLGSLVQILPIHACSTAAQFEHFYIVEAGQVIDKWDTIRGW